MFSLSSPISISTKIKETIEKSNRKYAEQKLKEHEKKQHDDCIKRAPNKN